MKSTDCTELGHDAPFLVPGKISYYLPLIVELPWLKEISRNGVAEHRYHHPGDNGGRSGVVNNLCTSNPADSPLMTSGCSGLYPNTLKLFDNNNRRGIEGNKMFFTSKIHILSMFIKMVRSWFHLFF